MDVTREERDRGRRRRGLMDRRRLKGFGSPRIALFLVCLGFGLILGVSSLSASSTSSFGSTRSYAAKRSTDVVRALAVEPGGTLVAAGSSRREAHARRFALARYTAAGKLDRRFGSGGRVLTGFGLRFVRPGFGSWAEAASLAIPRDGRIVVAGYAPVRPSLRYSAFALARYTVSGRLDRTFGGKGTVLTSFGSRGSSSASVVALTTDGKIVAAGYCDCRPSRFALARYKPGGRLDESFDRDGKVLTGFAAHSEASASAVAIQPDGKIVVAGDAFGATDDFAVAR